MVQETFVVIVRSILAFVSLIIFTRALGKQQISQLTFFEYIVGITIGSTASTLSTDLNETAYSHWIAMITWTLMALVFQVVALKSRWWSKVIDGEPLIVIHNGKILEKNMSKARYRIQDLMSQLRQNGMFEISQVEFGVVEIDGKLSVLPKSQYRNLQPKDLNMATEYEGISTELVHEGRIITQNLKQLNLTEEWLLGELEQKGVMDLKEVMYAVLNSKGELYFDKYIDHIQNPTDISDYEGPN